MAEYGRERRVAELQSLWKEDPNRLVVLYRGTMRLEELSTLLPGLTVGDMIEAILDKEEQPMKE
jgi:hypothetical protein